MATSMRNGVYMIPASREEDAKMASLAAALQNPSTPGGVGEVLKQAMPSIKAQFPPLEVLPCAKVIAAAQKVCKKPGTKACANCRLVSYCSTECQKEHWKTHKQDCKNPMGKAEWLPDWAMEGRQPSFMDSVPGRETIAKNDPKYGQSLAMGVSVWGNTPAVDVLNLPKNENNGKRDYSIAFAVSGDLRHLVKTVNKLPEDFSGTLSSVLNDGNPYVATRNLTILVILGKVEDEVLAADIALHFWYSAWIPTEYHFHITYAISQWAEEEANISKFGKHSTLASRFSQDSRDVLAHSATISMSPDAAQQECDRVKHSAWRKDFRDRYYYKLKPSHRVAYQEFRRFGLLLPFGAANHHFNYPNTSLFSKRGQWLPSDFADPLEGWDVAEVLDAGKRHGAMPEDIYGCLYFYISEQLRLFVRRLRTFKISLTLFDGDTCQLATFLGKQQQAGASSQFVLPNPEFDRIFLSNVTDENYAGLRSSIEAWAPLLSKNSAALILAYFLNWVFLQPDGRVRDAVKKSSEAATNRCLERFKIKERYDRLRSNISLLGKQLSADLPQIMSATEAFYDNSQPFATYLQKRGLNDILKTTGLILRQEHTVVPHRLGISLEAPSDSVPYLNFQDDASWYNHGILASPTWVERFVEFGWP